MVVEYLNQLSGIIPPRFVGGIFQHFFFKIFMESTHDRVRRFLSKVGHREVSEATGIKEERCKTIRYDKRANLRTSELDLMAERYPEYSLWLRTGRIDPANGEISPDDEETSRTLANPAG
ncbi:hypothetical protein [Pseudomonas indica]|uniref:hypothetical protein n=1 Tax=Pseudomonas indica TaxID=137658 RepID=UPI00114098B5|nr:hypothetical protein [Pseudomonas indica]